MVPLMLWFPQIRLCVEKTVESLLQALESVADSRKARGVRYPLGATLALCIVAFICGRQNLTQVMRFGRSHPELLEELGFSRKRRRRCRRSRAFWGRRVCWISRKR
jgi:hypothetical protein